MGSLSCSADVAVAYLFNAFSILLVVKAVLSFVPSLRGRWTAIVDRLVDPVLQPVDRLIPPIAGFSIAFIIVLALCRFLGGYFMNLGMACRLGVGG